MDLLLTDRPDDLKDELIRRFPHERAGLERFFRDVRLFLNTVQHALTVMNAAGVPARCRQEEQGDELVVTIRIPKKEENPKKTQIQ